MSILIRKPHKIIASRERQYDAHYSIPSAECLIVPMKSFGAEVLCEIHWVDTYGDLQVLHSKMFLTENLEPLNALMYDNLYAIWQQYYSQPSSDSFVVET